MNWFSIGNSAFWSQGHSHRLNFHLQLQFWPWSPDEDDPSTPCKLTHDFPSVQHSALKSLGTNFALTRLICNSSVKMLWTEPYEMLKQNLMLMRCCSKSMLRDRHDKLNLTLAALAADWQVRTCHNLSLPVSDDHATGQITAYACIVSSCRYKNSFTVFLITPRMCTSPANN